MRLSYFCDEKTYFTFDILRKTKNTNQQIRIQYMIAHWKKRKRTFILHTLLWPLRALFFSLKRLHQHGRYVKTKYQIGFLHQFVDLMYFALVHSFSPCYYYSISLYKKENRKLVFSYTCRDWYRYLLIKLYRKNRKYLENKIRFYRECRAKNLPVADIIAEVANGKVKLTKNSNLKQNIFAKPTTGALGRGTMLFSYIAENKYIDSDGEEFTEKTMLDRVAACEESYILQPQIKNSKAFIKYSKNLCSLRIYTYQYVKQIKCAWAFFLIPAPSNIISNTELGGTACLVDKEHGTIVSCFVKQFPDELLSVDPVSKQNICGAKIPFWQQSLDLCIKAHHIFDSYLFVGWDIILNDEGPLLLEGNSRAAIEVPQIMLGPSCFSECREVLLREYKNLLK